jgi:hypothetical protein
MSTKVDTRQGCLTVLVNAIKNIFFYGIATWWAKFIGGYIWWLGIIFFAILALMTAANIAMYVVSTISVLLPRRKTFMEQVEELSAPASDNSYLIAASLIRCLKEAICVLYLVYLYRFFF